MHAKKVIATLLRGKFNNINVQLLNVKQQNNKATTISFCLNSKIVTKSRDLYLLGKLAVSW